MKLLKKITLFSSILLSLNANKIDIPYWVNPSIESCELYGGIIKDGYCDASFYDGIKICEANGYILPTIEAFKITSEYCGAKTTDEYLGLDTFSSFETTDKYNKNKNNEDFHQCIENLGFDTVFDYLSSNKEPEWNWKKLKRDVITYNFGAAITSKFSYTDKIHVRCIK